MRFIAKIIAVIALILGCIGVVAQAWLVNESVLASAEWHHTR